MNITGFSGILQYKCNITAVIIGQNSTNDRRGKFWNVLLRGQLSYAMDTLISWKAHLIYWNIKLSNISKK